MLDSFLNSCADYALNALGQELANESLKAFSTNNGNIPKWQKAIEDIDSFEKSDLSYHAPYINIQSESDNYRQLENSFKQLIPWRKGPYQIGNIVIDSEWSGNLKWDRVFPHIRPLKNKIVLDVGAGNGYFTFLMALSGANLVIGLEPFLLFNYQFQAIRCMIRKPPNAYVLPLRLEQAPDISAFDTIFSMGVLYHQRDHMLHLHKLKKMLKKDGELILETLVIEDDKVDELIPNDRYARMRNVWRIPSISIICSWIEEAGFSSTKLVDINQTSVNEQRATPWIGKNAKSLADFLDSEDQNFTVEGYPAPKRATFICRN